MKVIVINAGKMLKLVRVSLNDIKERGEPNMIIACL